MIKKTLPLLLFLICIHNLIAQSDSIKKNHLSVNLASGLISGEVGFFYDHRINDKFAYQISYGHRFYNFNIIVNGGSGLGYLILPQTGDIARIGFKRFIMTRRDKGIKPVYLTGRLSYWNLHTPKYCTRDGSNGLNSILRETISVEKYWGNIAVGIGKEFYPRQHIFFDLFYSVGISAGVKKIHKYAYGMSGSCDSETYPDNTFKKKFSICPTIELGCKFGFSW